MRRAWWLLLAAACTRDEHAPHDCVELPPAAMDLGFDTAFALRVRPGCATGPLTWRQVSGSPVPFEVRDQMLSARTPPLPAELAGRWGVLPISPRTRGLLVFEARWPAGAQEVTVASAARARGLPNVPVGARVHLGGTGWRVVEAPPGGPAPALDGSHPGFVPDRDGEWRLLDGAGRELRLRSGRYDDTPLDCGRSGCHPAITEASAHSPMTTTLARRLGHVAGFSGCALGCHATGDPGIDDGGFAAVAAELQVAPSRWQATPRPLRRLGGVGCLACHGPGAVPEASARWSILRADVCANCHDAPPRYGHVAAWRGSRMAAADGDPRAREGDCARCHTTAGFLASVLPGDRRAPPEAGPVGIGCAACHAVHARDAAPRLVRAAPASALGPIPAVARRSAICVSCHAPGDAPASSAAALALGRGGLDPRTGEALEGPAPHGAIDGGCLACHRAPPGASRGAGHSFAATSAACRGCHGPLPANPEIAARAARLWAALGQADHRPAHAARPLVDRSTARGRATWNVLLVLEDPAAAVHNPRYAARLLSAAEEVLR